MSQMEQVQIRRARPEDAKAIAELARAFQGVSIDWLIEQKFGLIEGTNWFERKSRALEAEVLAEPESALVAEVDGRIVGFVTTRYDSRLRVGHIPNLAVAEDFQGKGIGKKLMQAAYELLRDKGAKWLAIETLTVNERGQRFYPKLGFEEVARKIYYFMPIENWRSPEQ